MDQQHPPGKSLTKHILDLLKLAQEKGFPNYIEYYDPLEAKSWRHDEFVYCAVVCAALQTWLRIRHRIIVWVEPHGRAHCWKGLIRYYAIDGVGRAMAQPVDNSYEYEFINVLTEALKAVLTPDETNRI